MSELFASKKWVALLAWAADPSVKPGECKSIDLVAEEVNEARRRLSPAIEMRYHAKFKLIEVGDWLLTLERKHDPQVQRVTLPHNPADAEYIRSLPFNQGAPITITMPAGPPKPAKKQLSLF